MCLAVAPASAKTFTATGVLQSSANFSGTIDIDVTTGAVTNWNVPLPAILGLPAITFTPANSTLIAFTSPVNAACPSGSALFGFGSRAIPGWD